jgi:hypothetical protein
MAEVIAVVDGRISTGSSTAAATMPGATANHDLGLAKQFRVAPSWDRRGRG